MNVRIPTLFSIILLQGCSLLPDDRSVQSQLQQVAKEWCMTIRASQMLCTFPLTEDVQVGDLYVVSTPIEEEVRQYHTRGFLPFDLLLWRLQPDGFEQMYRGYYDTQGFTSVIPHQWQFPADAAAGATAWASAPGAGFPTYGFSVKRGDRLDLALPLQSVSLGMSLMNAESATGSVAIDDASTYGVPVGILDRQVDEWASSAEGRRALARYAPGTMTQYYLRVVARVYVAAKFNVALRNGDANTAADTSSPIGTTPPAAALVPSTTTSTAAAPVTITKGTPGGSIRIAAASRNSVSMSETFPRPLVIGYVAFDRPISPGGVLGPSVPTFQRLERRIAN
jgi:hypothetical protein